MSTPYDQGIDELLALYRTQREEAAETRRRINAVIGSATAPGQTVKTTVTAQGEVTAIEFLTGAYRRMAPKELSTVLLTTIGQARSKALEAVNELTTLALPSGVTVADLLQGKVDGSALLPTEPSGPAAVRDYLAHGRPANGDPFGSTPRGGYGV